MNRCRQCGATLPDNSMVCLQCGTDNRQREVRADADTPQAELDFLQPSLKAGLGMGVLMGIPLVSCLCCVWVIGGGGLATWLLNKQRPGGLKYGDGALTGGLSGLIGGLVGTLIGLPLTRLLMTPERVTGFLDRMAPNIPPEARENIMKSFSGFELSTFLMQMIINICLFGLFALIGGILMVAFVNRKKTD
jgi:hypothetical protein